MNKITKMLPALAMVLAATLAFAFSPKEEATEQWGQHDGDWYNVTTMTPGIHYVCDDQTASNCLYDSPLPSGNPINPGENKLFVKLP